MCRILLLCLLVVANVAHAQTALDTGSFLHFTASNELPTDNVYSVIQDKKGYIWFATDNGVVKYNGYSFEVYNTENGGLPANDVFELHEDNRGRIWLNSFSYRYGYLKNGKFKSIHLKKGMRMTTAFLPAEAGDLYYFIDFQDDRQTLIFVLDDVIASIPISIENGKGDDVWFVVPAPGLQFSFFMKDKSMITLDRTTAKFRKTSDHYPDIFRYNYAHRTAVTSLSEVFLSSMTADEIDYYDIMRNEHRRLNIRDLGASPTEKIYTFSPYDYKGNYIALSTIFTNSHIYTFSPDLLFIGRQAFTEVMPSRAQLAFRTRDRSNNIWYSTKTDGVWFRPAFYPFYSQLVRHELLHNANYLGVIDRYTYWWDRTSLTLYELENTSITKRWKYDRGVEILSICGNDSLAYLTASDGLHLYDRRRSIVVNISDSRHIMNEYRRSRGELSNIRAAMRGSREAVLVDDIIYSYAAEGLRKFKLKNDTISITLQNSDRYKGRFFDRKNNILYSYSDQRIHLHNTATGKENVISDEQTDLLGIKNIQHLEVDNIGNVFILDANGLMAFNANKGTIKRFDSRFSVARSMFKIHGDELIIAGRFGLAYARILGPDSISAFYTLPDAGSQKKDMVKQLVITPGGTIFLQTNKDVLSCSLDTLRTHALKVQPAQDHFTLLGLQPEERSIKNNDTLQFPQNENMLKLDAINLYGKGDLRFSYRTGKKEKWETSQSGEIFLAALAPGKYHMVECRVSDDVWRSNTFTFYLFRHPYWWQTTTWRTIFWTTGTVLFLGLVLVIILITRSYVARKSEKKRALTELELRAIHSQINPHFIFNTLSASLYFINKKRFDDAYEHVNKFSRLLRSYLKSSQDRFTILEEEISMLRNYIELQQIRFEEKFEYSIEIDNKLPLNNIRIPSLLLQPLVENAINHGLFHKGANGRLDLRFLQGVDSSELICIIEDNGVGREAAKRINEVSSTRESYGTKLTNQLLDVFKEYEHMDISLEYTDKEAPETGTIVTLTLRNIKYVA